MNATLILTTTTLGILLAFSAFFSASETALTSLTKAQRRRFGKGRSKSDRAVTRLLRNPSRTLTTLLVGNNIVNIWSSSLATAFAIGLFGAEGVGIATVFMTIIILIFSEITPKTITANDPEGFAPVLAPAVGAIGKVLFPLVTVLIGINDLFISLLRRISPDKGHGITVDEVKTLMTVGKKEGALEEGEHRLLNRAFDFTDLRLREIMTPRTSIAAVSVSSGITEIVETFRTHRFSRLPVYEGSLDNIRGMIHYKDILFLPEWRRAMDERKTQEEPGIADLIRPVLFVPETQTTWGLLREMERNSQNLAIVIDEHGTTAGLVTIDDAIAAVFGGIHDEYDEESTEPLDEVLLFGDNHLAVPGNLRLDDLSALIKVKIDSDWYDTVGGFILEKAEKLPDLGDTVRYGQIAFRVDDISGRRITRASVFIENAGK